MRKKILLVGASGKVAAKVLPGLSRAYDVVGISKKRDTEKRYCVDLFVGDLRKEYEMMFSRIFDKHQFDSIIWSPMLFFPGPLMKSTRISLHQEFDVAISLLLECLRAAMAHGFSKNKTLIIISSGIAFGSSEITPRQRDNLGSYSIVKRSQVILGEYLERELAPSGIAVKVLALGAVAEIPEGVLNELYTRAIENTDQGKLLYRFIDNTRWE